MSAYSSAGLIFGHDAAGAPGMTAPRPQLMPEKSTTVYVGKIAASVDDAVVRSSLDACGTVKSWKPLQDPETQKPKGFGFCEFEDAESVLRALRLLNGLALDGQDLLLKCNTATQKYAALYEQSVLSKLAVCQCFCRRCGSALLPAHPKLGRITSGGFVQVCG